MSVNRDEYFGFERVSAAEKSARVDRVFTSVAGRYDLMNDLMSAGIHRLWKRFAVHVSGVRAGDSVLDVAAGSGDCTALYRRAAGSDGRVIACDVNASMLRHGRDRLLDRGCAGDVAFVRCDAAALPFADGSFDCVNMAFGLRNMADRDAALRAALRVLRYGGTLVILEFTRVSLPLLRRLYDTWSMQVIPLLGELIAGDRESYRYLVESIRVHPDQESLAEILKRAGYSGVRYHNLSGGIVAVHRGYKL
jgi:demethylmenaquinone methyltransferase/2-methoxy-6-polyprenyl-1,4-benzoquinol methylase